MDSQEGRTLKYLNRSITRRQAIKAGGIGAVGLAFSKPLFETIIPKPAFADYQVLGNGCTPGYWKQSQHFDSWVPTGFAPGDLLTTMFSAAALALYPSTSGDTLLEALNYPENPPQAQPEKTAKIMLRQAVAAVLNAEHPNVDYPQTSLQIVTAVNDCLVNHNQAELESLKNNLESDNEASCPLN